MPELPEVRALSERLGVVFVGHRLSDADVLGFSGLKTVAPSPTDVVGSRLSGTSSRGKYLVLSFDERRMLIHFGNSGRLDIEHPSKRTRPRGSLARLAFGETAMLVRELGSERRAGLWVLGAGDDGPLGVLGPEPFEETFAEFVRTSEDRRHLHGVLRDQRTVAGIGRGYADDILHRAHLSPFGALAGMDAVVREGLLCSVREVLDEALARERERTGGLSAASLGDRFAVHRRAGEPCPNCGRRLERVSYTSHEIVYCPTCQTNGRVLADRRLSRLLR